MSYIDLNDDDICDNLSSHNVLMTKTKKLFINEYKCFIDPVKHLVHNDNKTYDYMINCMYNKVVNFLKDHNMQLYISSDEFKTQFIEYLYKYSKAKRF